MRKQRLNLGTLLTALSIGLFAPGFIGLRNGVAATGNLSRTHSGGGVTVSVTYLNPEGSEGPRFQVALNTHSVDLDVYDLKELSLVRDGAGKILKPSSVENRGGGHHRQVILTFPKPSAQAKSLELLIRDVANVKERVFRWGP